MADNPTIELSITDKPLKIYYDFDGKIKATELEGENCIKNDYQYITITAEEHNNWAKNEFYAPKMVLDNKLIGILPDIVYAKKQKLYEITENHLKANLKPVINHPAFLLDDLDNKNQFDVNYWETSANTQTPKKKKINYDDILNSLNLVVNKNGVLQYMTTNGNQEPEQRQYQQQQQQQPNKGKPLEPQVKNSQIYNKYFKDYKDPNAEYVQEVKVPQTIEEYNRMVLEENIKRIQERKRIAQIKSTKMLFESNNIPVNNTGNIVASKNNLRMMKFN